METVWSGERGKNYPILLLNVWKTLELPFCQYYFTTDCGNGKVNSNIFSIKNGLHWTSGKYSHGDLRQGNGNPYGPIQPIFSTAIAAVSVNEPLNLLTAATAMETQIFFPSRMGYIGPCGSVHMETCSRAAATRRDQYNPFFPLMLPQCERQDIFKLHNSYLTIAGVELH